MLSSLVATVVAANVFTPTVTQELRPAPDAPPTQLIGVLSEPLEGELSAAVKTWAVSQRARFGLHAASTLRFDVGFATRFGGSLHYLQVVDGLEVYQAKLVVTVDQRMRVVQVSSSLVSTRPLRSAVSMSEASALKLASRQVPFPALVKDDPSHAYGGAKAFYFAVDEELHAGWLVNVASYDRTKNWYVGLDGVTGEVLFVQNRVYTAEHDVNAYAVSPGGRDAGVGATPTVLGSLARADGGSFIGTTCEVYQADGGFEITSNDGGVLCGDQLTSYNCCTNLGCVPDAGPRRIVGPTSFMGFMLNVDIPVCDRVNQATNQRPEGDYRYPPIDPPTNRTAVEFNDPANSDTFAHVHAFYHVNRIYDWARSLSGVAATTFPTVQPAIGPFRMRDERRMPARKPAVLTNIVTPSFDIGNIEGLPGCLMGAGACRIRSFGRIDNAMFLPVEGFAQFPLPGLSTGVDTMILFQGDGADSAYDATILWHEFGHGLIYATSGLTLGELALDNRSANNEGGAMHEGFSDYIAGAFGGASEVGPYFGPRAGQQMMMMAGVPQDTYARSLTNTFSCPDVLWGEVHQDGHHVSAALWAGRAANQGTDNGTTYDAAFYAMLVSLAPNADFAAAAASMAARVTTAFGGPAGAAMTQTFTSKGVIGCSKVLEVTSTTPPRRLYLTPGAPMALRNTNIPGPFQFKLRVPNGAQRIRFRGAQGGGGGFGGGATPALNLLAKSTGPITFTRTGGQITQDAEWTGTGQAVSGGQGMPAMLDAPLEVRVPCGASSEVHVAISNRGGGAQLQNFQVEAEPLVNCMFPVDAGMPMDAGVEEDAGIPEETKRLPLAGIVVQPMAQSGCGCSAVEAPMLLAALALMRRMFRRRA